MSTSTLDTDASKPVDPPRVAPRRSLAGLGGDFAAVTRQRWSTILLVLLGAALVATPAVAQPPDPDLIDPSLWSQLGEAGPWVTLAWVATRELAGALKARWSGATERATAAEAKLAEAEKRLATLDDARDEAARRAERAEATVEHLRDTLEHERALAARSGEMPRI